MPRIDDDEPRGATHNSLSGSARQVVQARSIDSVVFIGHTFSRRAVTALVAIAALLCSAGIAAFVLMARHEDQTQAAGSSALAQTPIAAVVFTAPVPCRSGWVVPDSGQRLIPYADDTAPVGAVLSSDGNVTITVQGVSGQTVVLQSMTVEIVHRAKPMSGIYLPVGCQGELPPRQYVLNLDSPTPRVVPQPGSVGFPYVVSNDDPEQFVVTPDTSDGDVQWRMFLTWSSGSRHGQIVLDDSGKPFRTTAIASARKYCNGNAGWTSAC